MTCTCGHGLTYTAAIDPAPCADCKQSEIVVVGEAWGSQEEISKLPFQDNSGQNLRTLLKEAGAERVFFTNTINMRPVNNNFKTFLWSKKHAVHPVSLQAGLYMPEEMAVRELGRLKKEIEEVDPSTVVALGNTALWALSGERPYISKKRGTFFKSSLVNRWTLATYHPAVVLRQYKWQVILVADLRKAVKGYTEPAQKTFIVHPSQDEMEDYYENYLKDASLIAFDIETTHGRFITCIGFAPSAETAIVIPFILDQRNYWKEYKDELKAWKWVRKVLQLPCPKLGQGGLFDLQYLWRHNIPVKNYFHDTMILHHALQPELEKSLGFLSSVYCSEPEWKSMRTSKTGKEL